MVDQVEMEKRVYQVSLLLRRKPVSFIVQTISAKWNITDRQARNYIRLARKEWQKYFEKLKGDGIAYHVSQNRDLKDKAMTDGDYKLAFDIAREEAKLMGVYPAEKHEEIRKVIVLGKKEKPEDEGGNDAEGD